MPRIALLWMALMACSSGTDIPADVLPPAKFAEALVEFSIIEAAQQQRALPANYQQQPEVWTAEALSRMGTDTAQFNRSYRYYFTHPDDMKLVLKEAEQRWKTP